MTCPDHDVLHRMLQGQVGHGERQALQLHLDGCERCHALVLALVQQPDMVASEDLTQVIEDEPTTPLAEAPVPGPARLERGTVIGGDFVIERPLARGGMGRVYVAKQRSTGALRAVKVMHASLTEDETLRGRFLQEARLGGMLESEHVVEVVAAGVAEGTGTPWLAMELLTGLDLGAFVLEQGPLALGQAVVFMRQMVQALAAAHQGGIVHRDLKPANVFVVDRAERGPPLIKLLDFGIAKVLAGHTGDVTDAVGSPAWMAPEQSEVSESIRPATDVWALGLLAFFMLVGQPYWHALHRRGAGVASLMREVLFDPLVSGSARSRELPAAAVFPTELDGWLGCCLSRAPEERFVDAALAGRAFESALRS